jgi:hypothetical protein
MSYLKKKTSRAYWYSFNVCVLIRCPVYLIRCTCQVYLIVSGWPKSEVVEIASGVTLAQ